MSPLMKTVGELKIIINAGVKDLLLTLLFFNYCHHIIIKKAVNSLYLHSELRCHRVYTNNSIRPLLPAPWRLSFVLCSFSSIATRYR